MKIYRELFKGTVYLVGAGPGDFGLLTLRGKELLERCDVCIYDNLVNDRIISLLTRPGCEKIYVGKSGASHTMEQEEINRLIVEKARENKSVVRLKGGDPFIFGRGGEEALFLAEKGIRFEIVSGVSSGYAAPAYAGIPVTHRGYSSSVAFITGHEDPAKLESDIKWDKIATGIQTLVFLMGVKNLPLIMDMLIRHGAPSSTPAAVIENGCGPLQRTITGTLADIPDKVRNATINPPSIIIVGDVVSLRDKINWYETGPLFGKTIAVTRSREQASSFSARLEEFGANVIEIPAIRIAPPDDTAAVFACIEKIASYDWIIFTSANGVSYFFKYLFDRGFDSRKLSGAKVCAIGPATAAGLMQMGVRPELVPEKYESQDIARSLISRGEVRGKSFLLPRADIAPKTLSETLTNAGAKAVDDLIIYRTVDEDLSNRKDLLEMLSNKKLDLVTFTSSSTVQNFGKILRRYAPDEKNALKCAAIGPVTAEKAMELGFRVEIMAAQHTIEGLVEAICSYYRTG
ncbi:MAG: uroporphyrinogen-III C-methyltransferase [Spirochaetes bacterium RBG_16_49_21]|nr:MAG: uroporphyrinogen-III C-methyltransferase [Spirochaetes bacterium RBG_16_49_21]